MNYYSNTNSDSACRFEKVQDIFSLERYCRNIIQILIATALVVSKGARHLQLKKRLMDYYSNTNSNGACRFENGRTSPVRNGIKELLFRTSIDSVCRFEKGGTSSVEK